MSEERMIRVKKEDYQYLQEIDEMNSDLVGQEIFPSEEFQDMLRSKWESYELVAPKDWKPLCYQAQTPHPLIDEGVIEKVEGCGYGYYHQNAPGSCEPNYGCWECPYRKKRE
jgi:hypothetical protein